MCGIFGVSVNERSGLTPRAFRTVVNSLFKLSESRGKEAAGIAICHGDAIEVYKEAASSTTLLGRAAYQELMARSVLKAGPSPSGPPVGALTVVGHSRLVTNGSMDFHDNNQPVIGHGLIAVHNGIIVNDTQLWQQHPALKRHYQVDTEIILALMRQFLDQTGSPVEALRKTFQFIQGTASVAVIVPDWDVLVLATNNGSLYACSNERSHVFASELYMLQRLARCRPARTLVDKSQVRQVPPGWGCLVDLAQSHATAFSLAGSDPLRRPTRPAGWKRSIVDVTPPQQQLALRTGAKSASRQGPPTTDYRRFEIDTRPILAVRRCTRCVLPATMPFIEFDAQGVCNYCRNHRPMRVLGPDALAAVVEPFRRRDGGPDCLVTFSGGRDSSFGVHYVKTVLKLNPVAYTYDWGMVTDLARRNIARICGRLGVEHILISADIRRKRSYIRQNVTAWLKRPDLGTVPLFMAGDKQYFYFANKLRQQMGIETVVLCINQFERTNFKTGFCGVWQPLGAESNYSLSLFNQLKLAAYYGRQYLFNPSYLNNSLLDSAGAFFSFYAIPHNYLNLFKYIMWDEDEINTTLIGEYDWEVATDTRSTWRIGDGTASFYNYIYYCVAGLTENDTFRSNQIREGKLSREQAMDTIHVENQPRFDSIQRYCQTIGIDMAAALTRIQAMPKLYV